MIACAICLSFFCQIFFTIIKCGVELCKIWKEKKYSEIFEPIAGNKTAEFVFERYVSKILTNENTSWITCVWIFSHFDSIIITSTWNWTKTDMHAIWGFVKNKSKRLSLFIRIAHVVFSVCWWCCCCFCWIILRRLSVHFQLTFSILLFRAHVRTWNSLIHSVVSLICCFSYFVSTYIFTSTDTFKLCINSLISFYRFRRERAEHIR